jgi:magnesium-transporting ATPase (P-type)
MDAVSIVPGDVLIVRLGDIVPADIKVLGDGGTKEEQVALQVRSVACLFFGRCLVTS